MKKESFFVFPIFIVLYELATYLSNDMYLPALPVITAFFNISQPLSMLSLTCWFIGSFSIQLLTGPLSDRYGRRPILIFGCLLFIAANLIAGHTESYSLFLLARFMQGASVCCVVVAGYAGIHEFFDEKEAIKTVSFMNSLMILAPAFGPLLGAYIITRLHWSFIFDLLALLTLIALLGLCWFMPETNQCKTSKISLKQIYFDYINILKNRNFLVLTFSFCLVFSGLISWVTASPFLIMITLKKSSLNFGGIQLIVFGGFVLGTRIASFYAGNQYASVKIIKRGLVLIFIATTICLFASFQKSYNLEFYIFGMTLYAFYTGMIFSPMQRRAVFLASPKIGSNMAMFFTIMGLMCIVGSLAVNLFYNGLMVSIAIILSVFSVLSWLIFFSRGPGQEATVSGNNL